MYKKDTLSSSVINNIQNILKLFFLEEFKGFMVSWLKGCFELSIHYEIQQP